MIGIEGLSVPWGQLSERARRSLAQCHAIRARIRLVEPPAGHLHGDPEKATIEVRFAQPDSWRIARNGELMLLRDSVQHLSRPAPGATIQRRAPAPAWLPTHEIGRLGWGHPALFRDPPAFKTPLAGPIPTTVAGRDAWEVVLSAPGKKPYVLRLALDDATGLVLKYAAEDAPYIVEVTDISIDRPHPPETFDWGQGVESVSGDHVTSTPLDNMMYRSASCRSAARPSW